MKRMLLLIVVGVVVAALAWVRLAPNDPARWHVDAQVTADEDLPFGAKRLLDVSDVSLEALDAVIMATPRTSRLAGSVGEGHITYVTRSRIMGFPDYATVQVQDGQIALWSRLRYGQSDTGVNRARVNGWLDTLGQS